MTTKRKIERFWDFSVRTYRTDGVPDACLSLQNDDGADVNMLLYCLFASASEFSSHWAEHVVAPLRSARTWMKHTGCTTQDVPTDACMTLRDEVKSVEFAAEKLQQEVLESLAINSRIRSADYDQVLADVASNMELYARFADIEISSDVMQKFSVIVSAAYPKL